jgi:hypothetical protein
LNHSGLSFSGKEPKIAPRIPDNSPTKCPSGSIFIKAKYTSDVISRRALNTVVKAFQEAT